MSEVKNISISTNFLSESKTFLIFGGAGFIGSNLTERILSAGHRAIIVDDLSTGNIDNINPFANKNGTDFIELKIPCSTELHNAFKESDFVVHLAARVGVELAVNSPTEMMMNNLLATEYVVRKCHEFSKPLFLSSSSEIYGKLERDVVCETDYSYIGYPNLLRWAYSISKISDEFIVNDYKRKGLKAIIGRYFNFIGKNQSSHYGMVVPKFILQAKSNSPLTVYGDGNQKRTFCDVDDGIDAILGLIDKHEQIVDNELIAYNIGGKTETSIIDLANMVKEISASSSEIVHIPLSEFPKGFDEILRRKPDCSLIEATLNWHQKIELKQTLKKLIG